MSCKIACNAKQQWSVYSWMRGKEWLVDSWKGGTRWKMGVGARI